MKDFPNIPTINYGGPEKFVDALQIPEPYCLIDKTHNKSHIVCRVDVEKDLYLKGEAICGRETAGSEAKDEKYMPNCCQDCMKKFNEIMEEYLYDETNDEYYHPVRER